MGRRAPLAPGTEEQFPEKAPVAITAMLAGVFGIMALALAAIGIYGVIDHSVSRRMADLQQAFRMFRHSPRIIAMAVSALALGAGANTAILAVINTVLLMP